MSLKSSCFNPGYVLDIGRGNDCGIKRKEPLQLEIVINNEIRYFGDSHIDSHKDMPFCVILPRDDQRECVLALVRDDMKSI